MRFYYLFIFLFVSLAIVIGCGEESKEVTPITYGSIFGTVANKETGCPVEGASVDIASKVALTNEEGKYILKDVLCSDSINVIVTAANYKEYREVISLHQDLMAFDITLTPVESRSASILAVLDAISRDIEALDPARIPAIQSYISKDYTTGDDEATAFGIFAGVVPASYDKIPDVVNNMVKKYSKLEFKFANPDVKFVCGEDFATVLMRFMVYAEAEQPVPKKWEIVIDGKMKFRKEDGNWKMIFWALVPPFLKFEEKPI